MKYRIAFFMIVFGSVLCGQTWNRLYLDIQITGNPVHPNGPGGPWGGAHVECRDSVSPNSMVFYDLPVNSQGVFQDTIFAHGDSGVFTIRVWRCDATYLEYNHAYSFADTTLSHVNISQVVNDTCLVSHTGRSRFVHVTGSLGGNPVGSGAWAYTPVPLEFVMPSWPLGVVRLLPWSTETDAYGNFYSQLPVFSRKGYARSQVLDCNLNWIDYDIPFDLTQSDTVFFNLSTPCIGWARTAPGIDRVKVSAYVLDAAQGNVPIPNVPVEVLHDNTLHTFHTDANGFFADSIPVWDSTGTVNIQTFDCNGNVVSSLPLAFDMNAGSMFFEDSLVLACSPVDNAICQALFTLDTANSGNGEVRLWNSSTYPSSGTLNWLWDFGDAYYSTHAYPTHQYQQAGSYQLCLNLEYINNSGKVCSSNYCDTIGMDANGNIIWKGLQAGFTLVVSRPNNIGQDEEEIAKAIAIYPNPTNSSFRIRGIESQTRLKVADVLGRVWIKRQLNPDEDIRTDHLPAGQYVVQIENGSMIRHLRLIVR